MSELLGIELLYGVRAAGAVIAALCLGGVSEQRRRSTGAKQASPLELVKRSIRAITSTPGVLTPGIAGMFVAGAVSYLDEFAVLHLRDAGLPVWSFGVVAEVHDCAESEFRATAESVVAQLQQITGVVFGVAYGIIASRMSVGPAISMTAVVALGAYLLLTAFAGGARR